jgi:isopropylmalate/homocitrate/citramalate synthase
MISQSIASEVIPEQRFAFRSDIDLVDETLREGAERASVPTSLDAKCRLAKAIAETGVRSLVVGMFPDVPHNIDLLDALLHQQTIGQIPPDTRFIIISHVGETMRQTLRVLDGLRGPLELVWILAIHGVSDLQITHLFPTILQKDPTVAWDQAEWDSIDIAERRRRSLAWLETFLPSIRSYAGGGLMMGLIDSFRADQNHLQDAVRVAEANGIRQVRLLDTAGSCLPHQLKSTVGELVTAFPSVAFYGHFHDDFGMATANAVVGLSLGLRGVEVSVGGFANRAGHPPLAEVAVGLRQLYGIVLPGFRYDALFALSRMAERVYGLMENPAQAITGVITHSVQSGIRTELIRKAPQIFDILDPQAVGSDLTRMFGIRSGRDGILRFPREKEDQLRPLGITATAETADNIFHRLNKEWTSRSATAHERLVSIIELYQKTLTESFFTETEMMTLIGSPIARERAA